MREPPDDETLRWLTAKQAAKRANVSVRTIWRLAETGQLTPRRIRGCTRFDAREIDALFG